MTTNLPKIGSYQETTHRLMLIEDVSVVGNLALFAKAFRTAKTLEPYSKFLVCDVAQTTRGTWVQILAESMAGWFQVTETTKFVSLNEAATKKLQELQRAMEELQQAMKGIAEFCSLGQSLQLKELPKLWENFLFSNAAEIRSIVAETNNKKATKYTDAQLVKYLIEKDVYSHPFCKKVPKLAQLTHLFYESNPALSTWNKFYKTWGNHYTLRKVVAAHSKSPSGPQYWYGTNGPEHKFWEKTYGPEGTLQLVECKDKKQWFTTYERLQFWCEKAIQDMEAEIQTIKQSNP